MNSHIMITTIIYQDIAQPYCTRIYITPPKVRHCPSVCDCVNQGTSPQGKTQQEPGRWTPEGWQIRRKLYPPLGQIKIQGFRHRREKGCQTLPFPQGSNRVSISLTFRSENYCVRMYKLFSKTHRYRKTLHATLNTEQQWSVRESDFTGARIKRQPVETYRPFSKNSFVMDIINFLKLFINILRN